MWTNEFYGKIMDLEPGDGTRYSIILNKVGDSTLVTWLKNSRIGGPSFLVLPGLPGIEIQYFMEKTGIVLEHDAQSILQFMMNYELIAEFW